jgi:hypothetical protein
MFKSKRELVSSFQDILRGMIALQLLYSQCKLINLIPVGRIVMEQATDINILHHDCSLNNMMIEDLESSTSCGLLLDWKFDIEVNKEHSYNVGGTISHQTIRERFHTLSRISDLLDAPSHARI